MALKDAFGLVLACDTILFILQSIIIYHFVRFLSFPNVRISKRVKYPAVIVLVFTWLAFAFDLLFISLQIAEEQNEYALNFSIINDSFGVYLQSIRFILFESILCLFWYLRINHTFKTSSLSLSAKFNRAIFIAIILITIVFLILFAIFFYNSFLVENDSSSNKILQLDINNNSTDDDTGNHTHFYLILLVCMFVISHVIVVCENIFFGCIFWKKLKMLSTLLKNTDSDFSSGKGSASGKRKMRIFQLSQKHTLLAIFPIVYSILTFIIFDLILISVFFFGSDHHIYTDYSEMNAHIFTILNILMPFANVDMIVKAVCMILFFKYYEVYFIRLCRSCLRLTQKSNNISKLFPDFVNATNMTSFDVVGRKRPNTIYLRVEKRQSKEKEKVDRFMINNKKSEHRPVDVVINDECKTVTIDLNCETSGAVISPTLPPSFSAFGATSISLEDEDVPAPPSPPINLTPYGDAEGKLGMDDSESDDYDWNEDGSLSDSDMELDFGNTPGMDLYGQNGETPMMPIKNAKSVAEIVIKVDTKKNTGLNIDENIIRHKFSTEVPTDDIYPAQIVACYVWMASMIDDSVHLNQYRGQECMLEENTDLFFDTIRDGVLLCELLNIIQPNLINSEEVNKPTPPMVANSFFARSNINMYIQGCLELGLRPIQIFDTNDLYEGKRLSKVIKHLYALSAHAKAFILDVDFDGPYIVDDLQFAKKKERNSFQFRYLNAIKN